MIIQQSALKENPSSSNRHWMAGRNREKDACAVAPEIYQVHEPSWSYNLFRLAPSPSSVVARYSVVPIALALTERWGSGLLSGRDGGAGAPRGAESARQLVPPARFPLQRDCEMVVSKLKRARNSLSNAPSSHPKYLAISSNGTPPLRAPSTGWRKDRTTSCSFVRYP